MPVIKAAQAPATVRAFSMGDIEKFARQLIVKAQQEAEQLLAAARQEAEELRKQAKADGFAEGRREGLAKGAEEGKKAGQQAALTAEKAKLTELAKALTSAAKELDAQRKRLETEGLKDVIDLASRIARRVTKRQGLVDPEVLCANVAEVMKLVVHSSDVRIAVHPTQKQTLADVLPKLQLQWPNLEHVELIDDPALAPGGCRVFTASGMIDADLDEQLDRVVADLLPHAPTEAKAP
jgi:flagellar assembly protein FliH